MAALDQVQPVVAHAAAHLDQDLSLEALARQSGWSAFHLHRAFRAITGETPRQFTERLRVSDAAARLLTTDQSVLEIALEAGFESHEVFTRAFRRLLGVNPRRYRERGLSGIRSREDAEAHAAWVKQIGPCIGLYGYQGARRSGMSYSIEKRTLEAQPVLTARKRVARADIAPTIGALLGEIFAYAQKAGIALAGHPLTRYYDMSAGMVEMEPSMRIVAATKATGEGNVRVDQLPAGPAAVTMHTGPYDSLHEAYAALEQWIEAQGLKPAGAPWESYVTDPGQVPDPKDWKTEVFWPVTEA